MQLLLSVCFNMKYFKMPFTSGSRKSEALCISALFKIQTFNEFEYSINLISMKGSHAWKFVLHVLPDFIIHQYIIDDYLKQNLLYIFFHFLLKKINCISKGTHLVKL